MLKNNQIKCDRCGHLLVSESGVVQRDFEIYDDSGLTKFQDYCSSCSEKEDAIYTENLIHLLSCKKGDNYGY